MARRPTGRRSTDATGRTTVHGKSANGEGSVYFASDGRWRASYCLPGDTPRPDGQRQDQGTGDRPPEEALAQAPVASPISSTFSHTATVGQVAEWWLNNVQRHQVRPSTWAKAEDRVRRIVATLGSVPIVEVRVEHVAAWQTDLLNVPLKPKTVSHHRQTLAQVFDQAVEFHHFGRRQLRRRPSARRCRTYADLHAEHERPDRCDHPR